MTDARVLQLIDRARQALKRDGFDKVVAFDFGSEGRVRVDGPAGVVGLSGGAADCELAVSLDDFLAMADGRLDPAKAFLRGRFKVSGDMGVALDLARRLAAR